MVLSVSSLLVVGVLLGNRRLQDMMSKMASERNGTLYATDERYCIDNGAMIAHNGAQMFSTGHITNWEDTNCLQRYLLF